MKKFLSATIIALFCLTLSAQELRQDTLEVYFRQRSSLWDAQYKDNGKNLEAFIERFSKLYNSDQMKRISKIHIVATCSPEGFYSYNSQLAARRAESMRKVLGEYIDLPDSVIVENPVAINWDGLRKMVMADPEVPHREEVLDIIDNSPELFVNDEGKTLELRKQRLLWRFDGKAWEYMYEKFYPSLRSFNLQIVVDLENYKPAIADVNQITGKIQQQTCTADLLPLPPHPICDEPEGESPTFRLAAKTNLLSDLALIPNVGLELHLGKGFSMEANYMHAWWHSDPYHWYWRTYGAELGFRKYFGRATKKNPLTGHHIGVYGQMLTYDFELGNMGIIGGKPLGDITDEPNYIAGLEYGYSLPVARRFNIDFSIGFGYHWGIFYEYLPIDGCYVWQTTKKRNYIGPTKAGISLVWLIGKENINETRKGGER